MASYQTDSWTRANTTTTKAHYFFQFRLETVSYGGYKKIFLIISKKLDSTFIINKLVNEGSYGKYQLMAPAGKVSVVLVKEYLIYIIMIIKLF